MPFWKATRKQDQKDVDPIPVLTWSYFLHKYGNEYQVYEAYYNQAMPYDEAEQFYEKFNIPERNLAYWVQR